MSTTKRSNANGEQQSPRASAKSDKAATPRKRTANEGGELASQPLAPTGNAGLPKPASVNKSGNNDLPKRPAAKSGRSKLPKIGKPAPDFELPSSSGGTIRLSELKGRKAVLFFYPNDLTPTCTEQACHMRDANASFEDAGAVVIGISANDLDSHHKFVSEYALPFPLLADVDLQVCHLYGVWQEKQLYGRKYMGIVRSTFLIDEAGILRAEWRNVRLKGHVDAIKAALAAG